MREDEAVQFLRGRGYSVQAPNARLEGAVLERFQAGASVGQISEAMRLPRTLVFTALWACGVRA